MLTFDITNDFIVGDRITKETLNKYSKLPHKIKAGLFLLCVEGSVQASINLAKYTINKYDFVTLVPSNFIQFHEISDDARFYFAGFSSEFMTNINFIKSTMSFLPVITEHPIMPPFHRYMSGPRHDSFHSLSDGCSAADSDAWRYDY